MLQKHARYKNTCKTHATKTCKVQKSARDVVEFNCPAVNDETLKILAPFNLFRGYLKKDSKKLRVLLFEKNIYKQRLVKNRFYNIK